MSKPRLDKIIEAIEIKITNDNDGTNRLFAETIYTDSITYSRERYEKMEEELNAFEIKGQGFIVYAFNDISGFDYWNLKQEENNYIQITVQISSRGKVDVEALNKALAKAQNKFKMYGGGQ